MKKIPLLITALISLSVPASAGGNISVYLNGEELTFSQPPIIYNDYTLVPFRAIFEKLDMTVQWFESERRVTAQKEGLSITLFINNPVMTVNSDTVRLAVEPIIYNDYTFVPLRAVSEAAGAETLWDEETKTVTITTAPNETEDWGMRVLELTNDIRAEYNLAPLIWDDTLASLAKEHCEDMANRDYFSHDTPEGKSPFDRMKDAGLKYVYAGENIAAGHYSPEEAVNSWMKSEGHRENILNPNYKSLGVSFARGGSYGIYWVQEFARFSEKSVIKK